MQDNGEIDPKTGHAVPAGADPALDLLSPPAAVDGVATARRNAQTPQRPGETFLRGDIELSADYRKEYYKYVLAISTALLAFTISFQPTLRVTPEYLWLEMIGWGGLGIAVASGVRIQMVWSKFFSATQKYLNKGLVDKGKAVRTKCNKERRFLEGVMLIAFIAGVAGVIGFTAANLKNVALKTDDSSTTQKKPSTLSRR